jgi:hypothetical protein
MFILRQLFVLLILIVAIAVVCSTGARRRLGPAIGVPRRFGIGSLLAVTAACAVFFSILRCRGCPPLAFAILGSFFALVGIGQAVLFGGKEPRKASMLVGAAVFCLGVFVTEIFFHTPVPISDLLAWICLLMAAGSVGSIFGYLAGSLIAGIFLVLDRIERRCKSPARHQPASPPIVVESDEEPADRASAGQESISEFTAEDTEDHRGQMTASASLRVPGETSSSNSP